MTFLLAALCGFAAGPPAALAATVCETMPSNGDTTFYPLAPVEAKKPGETSFTAVPLSEMCAYAYTNHVRGPSGELLPELAMYARIVFTSTTGDTPESPGLDLGRFPIDTVYRIHGEVPGFVPVAAGGRSRDPVLSATGAAFTVEGKAVTINDGTRVACDGVRRTWWAVSFWPAERDPENVWRGTSYTSNAHTLAPPQLIKGQDGPQLFFDIAGCGDGDPSTKDGFLSAFLPLNFLAALGISQADVEAASDEALDDLFAVTDNGTSTEQAKFTKPSDGRLGVKLDYAMSFSVHKVAVAPAKKKASPPVQNPPPEKVPAAPAKPIVKWTSSTKRKTVTATIKTTAGSAITHGIKATKLRSKKAKNGTCTADAKKATTRCTVKLSKGRWAVSITPRQGSTTGTANTKTFRF